GLAIDEDRNTNESQLLTAENLLPDTQPVEKHRLTAYLRHHDRFTALHDAAGNSLSQFVAHAPGTIFVEAMRSHDLKFLSFMIEQSQSAANHPMMPAQAFKHAGHSSLQLESAGQSLAGLKKSCELTRFCLCCCHILKKRS